MKYDRNIYYQNAIATIYKKDITNFKRASDLVCLINEEMKYISPLCQKIKNYADGKKEAQELILDNSKTLNGIAKTQNSITQISIYLEAEEKRLSSTPFYKFKQKKEIRHKILSAEKEITELRQYLSELEQLHYLRVERIESIFNFLETIDIRAIIKDYLSHIKKYNYLIDKLNKLTSTDIPHHKANVYLKNARMGYVNITQENEG